MSDKRRYSALPKKLGQYIEPLTRPVFKANSLAGTRLLSEWEHVVGNTLAQHSMPQKITFPAGKTTGGTLTIAAGSGFATELQHMQPVILERLCTYFGYKAISRIAISHTYQKQAAKKTVSTVRTPLRKGSESLAEEVTDPELKEALKSLAKTLTNPAT